MSNLVLSYNLFVTVPPAVTAESRVAANVREVAELSCESQANPRPTFYWKRGGQVNTSLLHKYNLTIGSFV